MNQETSNVQSGAAVACSALLACPMCGMEKQTDVFVGIRATELGPKYWCGTIWMPSEKRITVFGVACRRIQQLQEQLRQANAEVSHE
jgi:hypothetical protein